MSIIDLIALLMTVTAGLAYLNSKVLKLPPAIGLMVCSLVFSLIATAAGVFIPAVNNAIVPLVENLNFEKTVMNGMLSILLFAGALHVNLNDLKKEKLPIGILATLGTLISTILTGAVFKLIADACIGPDAISWAFCFLFGSLISPTDPIAVLSILKSANCPKDMETRICGESLFNDGFAVVVFLVLFSLAVPSDEAFHISHAFILLLEEAVGGIVFGLAIGFVAYKLLKSIDNYQVEILGTLALVLGGYALAQKIHVSGPLAVVVAGLMIGNHGRSFAMSDKTREHLDTFWELLDEILNALLFVMIGFELLVLTFKGEYITAGLLAIPLTVVARGIAVFIATTLLKKKLTLNKGDRRILTWAGVRGGISIALALQIPKSVELTSGVLDLTIQRDTILTVTYIVVAFSIICQGLTVGKIVKHFQSS